MRTKEQIRDDLGLDELPDDEFMQLLAAVGEDTIVQALPHISEEQNYTPEEIKVELTSAIVSTTVAGLLARARAEAEMSLRAAGAEMGVSRARIQQIESSENPKVLTLLRAANALGYGVQIDLIPQRKGLRPISARLHMLES